MVSGGQDDSQGTSDCDGFCRERDLKTRPQTGFGSYCDDRLLPALRALCAGARRGQRFTRVAIARAAAVDKETVRNIERAALRKVRARLGPACPKNLEEIISFL